MNGAPLPDREPLISFRNVGVSYWVKRGPLRRKRFYALKDISFDLYRGDSLGVIGRNGCGKSTLLRLIAGVMTPDHGQAIGVKEVRSSLLTMQLGFVDYLSGRENAILSGMYLGIKKHDIESRIGNIIEFSELGEFIEQPLSTYSSGMRARLGFAVAFQLDPDILLVDEVLSVGDADFRAKSLRVMNERLSSDTSTVVFVSHTARQVEDLCNRVIWIEDGVVKKSGEADDVIKAYDNSLLDRHAAEVADCVAKGVTVFISKNTSNQLFVIEKGRMSTLLSWNELIERGGHSETLKELDEEEIRRLQKKYGS